MTKPLKICNQIMTYLIQHGHTKQVPVRKVEEAIIYVRGPDKRTIDNWKRALLKLGFLRLTHNKMIYAMNLSRTPELLTIDEIKQTYDEMNQTKLM